jgi:hypothetical protein
VVDLDSKLEIEKKRFEAEQDKRRRSEELKAAAVEQRNVADSRRTELQRQCRESKEKLLKLTREISAAKREASSAKYKLAQVVPTRRGEALREVYMICYIST